MPRVAVIGAGRAGIEAAKAAAGNGARVVLLDGGDAIPRPKSSWPSLLVSGDRHATGREDASLSSAGVDVQLGQRVAKLGGDLSVVVGGRKTQFDSVVVSTGSAPFPERFDGGRKRGVHVLDSHASFVELGDKLGQYSKAIVSGSGPVAVEIAEKIRSRRVAVSMLAPGGILQNVGRGPRRVIVGQLSSLGIQVTDAKPEKVVGVDKVEALLASGEVYPADCFVVVPRQVPAVPEVQAALGRSGGLLVNERMQSSFKSLFGAGDCVEVGVGRSSMPVMFESSAGLMGRVAGVNSTGATASANVVGSFYMEISGVALASAGLSLAESIGVGIDAVEVSKSWMGEMACSLVYERSRKTLVGVQLAGKDVGGFADSLPIVLAARMTLEQVAYQETPVSTDISPMVETAREGLAKK